MLVRECNKMDKINELQYIQNRQNWNKKTKLKSKITKNFKVPTGSIMKYM